METTGTRTRRAPYGNESHEIQVSSRWDHSHQVEVRPRYIREYPGPNDAQVRTRVNRSRRVPNMDQSLCSR